MPLRVGDCFWRQFPGDHDPRLWIIVTSPCLGYEPDTVTVSVTGKKSTSDLTCCLRVGDHPGLTKDSVISYYHSALRPSSQIETAVAAKVLLLAERVNKEIILRIQAGMLSADTPKPVQTFYTIAVEQGCHEYEE